MKAGFFCADISPALGMEMPGNYFKQFHTAFHDPLKARAAVFDDGGCTVALVGLDTCTIGAATANAIRSRLQEAGVVPAANVIIGASHTHSGGPLFGLGEADVRGASETVRRLALEESVAIDPVYEETVIRQVVGAVREAHRRREDALVSVGVGREEIAAVNRRFRMDYGRVVTHPGKGNPHIVEPAGPIDPDVGVVGAWRHDGTLLGCIVNYACHGTTFGGAISADWIGYLEKTVQGVMGEGAGVVFLNGACGDVTQVDNRSMRAVEFGESVSRRVGTRVGAEALKVLVSSPRGDGVPVASANTVLTIPRRPPSADHLARAKAIVGDGRRPESRTTEWLFAKELVILEHLTAAQPDVPVEVSACQIGPAVFVANPAEFFCRLGLDIKAESRFPFTFVVELANGAAGYVPDAAAFASDGGGYETVLNSYSNLVPEAGDLIVKASVELTRRLVPGAVAEAEQVTAVGTEWSYGVLGPDLG